MGLGVWSVFPTHPPPHPIRRASFIVSEGVVEQSLIDSFGQDGWVEGIGSAPVIISNPTKSNRHYKVGKQKNGGETLTEVFKLGQLIMPAKCCNGRPAATASHNGSAHV